MPRVFTAIPIPAAIQQQINREIISNNAFSHLRIRWTRPQNLHITLKFLGETPANKIPLLIEAINQTAAGTTSFSVQFEGAGVYPNRQNPRVIWLGITPLEPILNLWRHLEDCAEEKGFARESKTIKAHLTLARIADANIETEKTKIGSLITAVAALQLPPFPVNQIQLIQSILHPQGAAYQQIHNESLQPQQS